MAKKTSYARFLVEGNLGLKALDFMAPKKRACVTHSTPKCWKRNAVQVRILHRMKRHTASESVPVAN